MTRKGLIHCKTKQPTNQPQYINYTQHHHSERKTYNRKKSSKINSTYIHTTDGIIKTKAITHKQPHTKINPIHTVSRQKSWPSYHRNYNHSASYHFLGKDKINLYTYYHIQKKNWPNHFTSPRRVE